VQSFAIKSLVVSSKNLACNIKVRKICKIARAP